MAIFFLLVSLLMIRLCHDPCRLSWQRLRDDNEKEVTGLINQLNLKYKPYKFYIDGAKNLMAESCVILRDGEDAWGICSFLC